jgi:hypothetical protein
VVKREEEGARLSIILSIRLIRSYNLSGVRRIHYVGAL